MQRDHSRAELLQALRSRQLDKIPPPVIRRRVREAFRYLSHNGMQVVYSCPA